MIKMSPFAFGWVDKINSSQSIWIHLQKGFRLAVFLHRCTSLILGILILLPLESSLAQTIVEIDYACETIDERRGRSTPLTETRTEDLYWNRQKDFPWTRIDKDKVNYGAGGRRHNPSQLSTTGRSIIPRGTNTHKYRKDDEEMMLPCRRRRLPLSGTNGNYFLTCWKVDHF